MGTQMLIHPGPGFLGMSNLSTLINVHKSNSYLDTPNSKFDFIFPFWLIWLIVTKYDYLSWIFMVTGLKILKMRTRIEMEKNLDEKL